MTNRVDDTSAHQPPTRTDDGAGEVDKSDQTSAPESTDEATGTSETEKNEDVWEEATNPYGDYMEKTDGEVGYSHQSAEVEAEEAMSVWEMMVAGEASDVDETNEVSGDDGYDISENSVANQIAGMYDDLVEREVSTSEIGTEFNIQVFDDLLASGRDELIELAGHTDELQTRLHQREGDEDLADAVVEEVKTRTVSLAGERIASRARPEIQEGLESVEQLNTNSETRRGFLAALAETADGPDDITSGLVEFGVSPSTAEDIAEAMVEISNEGSMEAFLAGESGEERFLGLGAGSFEAVENDLESELDSITQGLESLDRSLKNNQLRHDKFLTDPTLAPFRDEVLEDMGAVTHPPDEVNGLGEMFIEATEQADSAQTWESIGETLISAAGGAVATLATGGTAAPVIAGVLGGAGGAGLQAVPGVAEAGQDVDRAQGEVAANFSSPELVEQAETDEKIAHGVAVASILTGGAIGAVGAAGDGKPIEVVAEAVADGGAEMGWTGAEAVATGSRDD